MSFMRQDDRTSTLSRSFGSVAEGYDRYRPGPPDAALDWLLPEGTRDVIELGAGTGALTRLLVARGLSVRAVEPDARMRQVLSNRVPGVEALEGTAEAIPAEDGSADVVIAASAWHWVDEARAVPEVARVLRPGGRLALLWSGTDRRLPWLRALWAGGRALDDDQAEVLDAGRRHRRAVDLSSSRAFGEPDRHLLSWEITMNRDELVGLVGTYSAVIVMDPDERRAFDAGVAHFLDTDADTAGRDTFEVPMRCLCWRVDRMDVPDPI
jgi:SAM-dependent methyltransferase